MREVVGLSPTTPTISYTNKIKGRDKFMNNNQSQTMMLVNILGDKLNEKETGMLMKVAAVEQAIQAEMMQKIDDAFYGRLIKLTQEKQTGLEPLVTELVEGEKSEMEIMVEIIKFSFSMVEEIKELDGYAEYREVATEVYGTYGIDYNEYDELTTKTFKMLGDEDVMKSLLKKLDV